MRSAPDRGRSTRLIGGLAAVAIAAAMAIASGAGDANARPGRPESPIKHVVVLFQENHSFDDVLGKFCVERHRCDGAVRGELHDGTVIRLRHAPDIVWHIRHTPSMMRTAIAGGKMNGFDLLKHCGADVNYACYEQYNPSDIPNLTTLANAFVVSDATFQSSLSGSWTSHLELVTSTLDGFAGYNPVHSKSGHEPGPGWGCDSFLDAKWSPPAGRPLRKNQFVPACIPNKLGKGPYRPSPVQYVPTILDGLDQAGASWKLYGGNGPKHTSYGAGYFWQICPTFYECLSSPQADNWVRMSSILSDATHGRLPKVSLVTPTLQVSQHNDASMRRGDDWIGQVVSAIENGPDWNSTAIFITYDECGCFYDHVPPPEPGRGIRVPMVIISPYAKPRFTDSHPASFNSILAFIEHTFGVPPMNSQDRRAYDYAHSFDYRQTPTRPVRLVRVRIPPWEERFLAAHPGDPDDT
jgi:phospholipase C